MAKEKKPHEAGIAVFRQKEVRRTLHNNDGWFVIAKGGEILPTPIEG